MKGLIIKDFCLMLQRKRSFLIILLCGIFLSTSVDPTFLVSWLILIGSIFSISTIAYDEHDNCYAFLMTLPASRKCYAAEKYVFGVLCSIVFWLVGVVAYLAVSGIKGGGMNLGEEMPQLVAVLFTPVLILDFFIPFNLKYGTEKSRVYMLIFWGAVFALGLIISRLLPNEPGINFNAAALPMPLIIAAVLLVLAVMTLASVCWSIRIMEKKQL